jgi:hypothetical protein
MEDTGVNFPLRASSATLTAFLVAAGLLVASCSGGSNSTPVVQGTATQSIPAGGGTITLPAAANGEGSTLTVGAGASAGTTITASASTTAPSGAPAPSSIRRVESIAGAVAFLYVTFSVNQSVSANVFTSETASILNSFPANASYYVEFDDVTSLPATKLGCAGPATVVGLSAGILNATTSGACSGSVSGVTFAANHTYVMQFYYVPAALAAFPCGSAPPSASGTLSGLTQLTPASFPALGSCSSTITFQGSTTIAGGTTVNVTTSSTLPVGAPTPLPTSPASPGATPQAVIYETLNVTAGSITVNSGANASPLQTITYANIGTCSTFAQSFAATGGGSWQGASAGNRTGLTVTFPAGQSSNTTVLNAAGSPYWIAYLCY